MANRLRGESSPYLLQHAENPVDWYAWGDEALDRAKAEDKPILLSIGYSACHWCHVMAHESFENPATAELMNERFVNIKVDREERPDVDSIYMEAVQALTGQGGWPLNVFLTPDGKPFFGGTYFPPEPRHGMPSWRQVVSGVAEAYGQRREEVLRSAETLTGHIRDAQERAEPGGSLDVTVLQTASAAASTQFDWQEGGFGAAPKFPQPLALDFILRMHRRFPSHRGLEFVLFTLRQMAAGGIFDHLGGGFHRYTVDGRWLVPHFEKMLYDNALLVPVYLHAFQLTGDPSYARVAERTLDYLLRDLCSPEGAFYAAEDADSEGVEGKYYVWTREEFERILGPERAGVAATHFGLRPGGNFEGKTILTESLTLGQVAAATGRSIAEVTGIVDESRELLFAARSRRIRPALDNKILTGWNALAINAFALAGAVLGQDRYLKAARRAADFMLTSMSTADGLTRIYPAGPGSVSAFLEDYAFFVEALTALYEITHEISYLRHAEQLADTMAARFAGRGSEAFFDATASGDLIARPRSLFDNPIPSGNASAALGLLRLAALTGEQKYSDLAQPVLRAVLDLLPRAPLAFPYLLSALDFYLSSPLQIAIAAAPDRAGEMTREVWARYLPAAVVAVGNGSEPALLEGREMIGGAPTAYVCRHFTCRLPVSEPAAFALQLDEAVRAADGS